MLKSQAVPLSYQLHDSCDYQSTAFISFTDAMALALFGDDLLSPFLGGQLSSSLQNTSNYGRSIPIDISEVSMCLPCKEAGCAVLLCRMRCCAT